MEHKSVDQMEVLSKLDNWQLIHHNYKYDKKWEKFKEDNWIHIVGSG